MFRPVQAMGKASFNSQIEKDIAEAASEMATIMVENLSLLDTQNGIKSFLNKEKPSWTHTDVKDD